MSDESFTYDASATFSINYQEWYFMNCEERDQYGEQRLTHEQAEKLFFELYGDQK